jgi:hypothetical protein
MTKPDDLIPCAHRIADHVQTCHCNHVAVVGPRPRAVRWEQCLSCTLQATDSTATAGTVGGSVQPEKPAAKPCVPCEAARRIAAERKLMGM